MSGAMEQREMNGTFRLFKPYPAYKDSGVEWLGEIPAHWEAVPIRSLARPGFKTFTDGDWIESPFIREEGVRLIQTGNVGVGEYREQGFRYVDEETFRAFRCTEVLPGDVLICRLADPVGRACLAPDLGCRMITSVDVCILKTSPTVDAGYVVFALSGSSYLSWMSGICRGGTRDRVSRSMLGSIRVQKPPYEEQRAIAAFLDRETAKVDALVAKKERLIELLQEKRTALITRAVTKGPPAAAAAQAGLDPNVPMKDSGVEWLGEIPAHWEAVPIRSLARPGFKTFTDGDWIESPFIREEGVRLIQTGNVGVGEYREQGFRYVDEETFRAFRCTEVLPGDVLICRLADPVGRACLAPDLGCRMITSVDVCILKTSPTVDAGYVVFALSGSSYLSWMSGICRGGTRDRVSRSMLGSIRVQKPPYEEQRAIAAFLDRETAKVDALVANVHDAIDRLKELRTALISAAVTGKIDVREEAA